MFLVDFFKQPVESSYFYEYVEKKEFTSSFPSLSESEACSYSDADEFYKISSTKR